MTIRRAGRRGGAGGSNGAKRGNRLVVPPAILAVCGALLSACGGGGSAATSATDRPTSVSSTSAATSISTADPGTAAVLAAYRAGWAAFEHALADANPEDPELAATMVDPQLQQVKANLLADQRLGMVGRGMTTLHPKVTAISATSATVVDCAYSSAELVYRATGKPVPPVTPPENDGVTSTLVLSGGTWKVSKQIVTDGKCALGS
jgi:hypothetical protein